MTATEILDNIREALCTPEGADIVTWARDIAMLAGKYPELPNPPSDPIAIDDRPGSVIGPITRHPKRKKRYTVSIQPIDDRIPIRIIECEGELDSIVCYALKDYDTIMEHTGDY